MIDAMKKVLANTYALYLKTQNYHWNVEGPHFKSLHLLFEEQYIDLANAVDAIAERIRMMGSKAPASFAAFEALKDIKDATDKEDAHQMLETLMKDQEIMKASLMAAFKEAQAIDDEVSIGLLIDRMSVHEKAQWMLKSSL